MPGCFNSAFAETWEYQPYGDACATTADCVVGGFRYGSKTKIVGSLLLGLYDDDGVLHHVGFTSSLSVAERKSLTPKLEKLAGGSGFTGRAPGGPSRWSTERSGEFLIKRMTTSAPANGR